MDYSYGLQSKRSRVQTSNMSSSFLFRLLSLAFFQGAVWAEQRKLSPGKTAVRGPLIGRADHRDPLELWSSGWVTERLLITSQTFSLFSEFIPLFSRWVSLGRMFINY